MRVMAAEHLFRQAKKEGRNWLMEDETKQVLEEYQIPVVRCIVTENVEEALEAARILGYPVVIKLRSPKIVHKSDVGGVILDLRGPAELASAYTKLLEIGRRYDAEAKITVQTMVPPGPEVIVGVTTDPHFGRILMVGLGGVFTEILRDVTYRLLPVSEKEALRMITSLKGFPLLNGYRGGEKVDLEAMASLMASVSSCVLDNAKIREVDLNPVRGYAHGALVLDGRIVLAG